MFYKIKKRQRSLDEKMDTLLTPEFFEYEKLEENLISEYGLNTKVYADDEALIKKARNFLLNALENLLDTLLLDTVILDTKIIETVLQH